MKIEKVVVAHESMMARRMMFGEVIREVGRAFLPIDMKLALGDSVLDPIKSHVDCLGSTLLDGFVGESFSEGIVRLYRGCRLGMSHFNEGVA